MFNLGSLKVRDTWAPWRNTAWTTRRSPSSHPSSTRSSRVFRTRATSSRSSWSRSKRASETSSLNRNRRGPPSWRTLGYRSTANWNLEHSYCIRRILYKHLISWVRPALSWATQGPPCRFFGWCCSPDSRSIESVCPTRAKCCGLLKPESKIQRTNSVKTSLTFKADNRSYLVDRARHSSFGYHLRRNLFSSTGLHFQQSAQLVESDVVVKLTGSQEIMFHNCPFEDWRA